MFINNIVSEYITLKETEKQMKKRIDELESIILEHAGDSDSFTTDDYTIAIKQTVSIVGTSISKSIVAAKRDNTKKQHERKAKTK